MSIDVCGVCTLIQVFDMPTSVRFYRDVLGFEVVSTSEREGDQFDWGLLRLNDTEIMLNTAYEGPDRPDAPERRRIDAHADTTFYFDCSDVDAAYSYLKSKGVSADPPKVAPYGMYQLYVTDPDGYLICFQRPAE